MNPALAAQNRTARLAREGNAPVWSTKTGDRPVWRVLADVRRTLPARPMCDVCGGFDC